MIVFRLTIAMSRLMGKPLTSRLEKGQYLLKPTRIQDTGGNKFNGGYQQIRNEQNYSLESKTSQFNNATSNAIYEFRGSQCYYQISNTTFSGITIPSSADATTFAFVSGY
jgi:hypothetical protein